MCAATDETTLGSCRSMPRPARGTQAGPGEDPVKRLHPPAPPPCRAAPPYCSSRAELAWPTTVGRRQPYAASARRVLEQEQPNVVARSRASGSRSARARRPAGLALGEPERSVTLQPQAVLRAPRDRGLRSSRRRRRAANGRPAVIGQTLEVLLRRPRPCRRCGNCPWNRRSRRNRPDRWNGSGSGCGRLWPRPGRSLGGRSRRRKRGLTTQRVVPGPLRPGVWEAVRGELGVAAETLPLTVLGSRHVDRIGARSLERRWIRIRTAHPLFQRIPKAPATARIVRHLSTLALLITHAVGGLRRRCPRRARCSGSRHRRRQRRSRRLRTVQRSPGLRHTGFERLVGLRGALRHGLSRLASIQASSAWGRREGHALQEPTNAGTRSSRPRTQATRAMLPAQAARTSSSEKRRR